MRRDFIDDALASHTDDCIIWPYAVRKSSGYGAYCEYQNGVKINFDIHRFVCAEVHGQPEEGEEAAHSCGNALCINPTHLSWKTPYANMADAKKHGTLRGGGRYRQRLFEKERFDIATSNASLLTLGSKYAMSPSYIGKVRREMRATQEKR